MHLVEFQLLSNHQFVYINADTVTAIYADTSRDGKKGTKIHTTDGDFTMVEEDLNRVLYALDSAVHPEDYPTEDEDEEEPQQVPQEIITAAAEVIKNYCKEKVSCINCPFCSEEYECQIGERFPSRWDIPKGDE